MRVGLRRTGSGALGRGMAQPLCCRSAHPWKSDSAEPAALHGNRHYPGGFCRQTPRSWNLGALHHAASAHRERGHLSRGTNAHVVAGREAASRPHSRATCGRGECNRRAGSRVRSRLETARARHQRSSHRRSKRARQLLLDPVADRHRGDAAAASKLRQWGGVAAFPRHSASAGNRRAHLAGRGRTARAAATSFRKPAAGGSSRGTRPLSCLANTQGFSKAGSCNASLFVHTRLRSEEHTSELQSQSNLVCRLLLEKKKNKTLTSPSTSWSFCSNRRV